MPVKKFDAVVLGSGQGGTPLATALAKSGRKTALIERVHLGGCCVNEGCTPTKTMVASGRIAHLAARASDYGVWQAAERRDGRERIEPTVEMEKVRQRKRAIVDSFRGGSEARLKKTDGLEVLMGEARFTGPRTLEVKMPHENEDVKVEAEHCFINVGCRPSFPALDGLEEVRSVRPDLVLDSTSIMELGEVPERLVVLGGGYIAMEFGQLFRRLGSQVDVVQRGRSILGREDAEVVEELTRICTDEGMRIHTNTVSSSVSLTKKETRIAVKCTGTNGAKGEPTEMELEGSHLLVAVGRTPNTDSLQLENAGVEMDQRGYIKVSPTLQTNVANIYALGDVKGGPAFTHISYDDYRVLKTNFIDRRSSEASIADRVVPYVAYTDPQLGHVGLHEAEARKMFPSRTIKTATMPMAYVARALETDETKGLMKAVVDGESGEILGFTCLGIEGGEIMSMVQVAMMGGLPYSRLQDACLAHPTLAESLNNLWGFLK